MDQKKLPIVAWMIHQSVRAVDYLHCYLILVEMCGCYLHQGNQDSVTYSITLRMKHHQLTHLG